MTEQITRAFAGDLSIRADTEGRTVAGIVVPFDTVARVSDGGPSYDERFQRGAFAKTIRERGDRVKLLYQHNSREPIGKAVSLREDASGLYGEFRVSKVDDGDRALVLVRDGVIDSFSVGFSPVKHEKRDGVTVRTEVALREASLVTFPAYDTARIHSLREALAELPEDERLELLRSCGIPPEVFPTADGQPGRNTVDEPVARDHSARNHIRQAAFIAAARKLGVL